MNPNVAKVALWSAAGSALFTIVVFGLFAPVPLSTMLPAMALIPLGGAVVGGLLATSFEHPEEHE